MTDNACGSCTLCCKLPTIKDTALEKPRNRWCQHCKPGKGCGIYEERPKSCSEFKCLWLISQQSWPEPMPAALRPDRCKVVIAPTTNAKVIVAYVEPSAPFAWKGTEVGNYLERITATVGTHIIINIDDNLDKVVLRPHGHSVGRGIVRMTPPDENGMQWYGGDGT